MDFELAAAIADGGGLASLPCAMLNPQQVREQIARFRARTKAPINLGFFCHSPPKLNEAIERRWRRSLIGYYEELGINLRPLAPTEMGTPFDDAFCDLVEETKPAVVSFHLGLPDWRLLDRVKDAGCVTLASATTVAEARWIEGNGIDVVIAQGLEAGGPRGMFLTADVGPQVGTFALVPQVVDAVKIPVIAAGGVGDARGIVAALALGAAGVQIGTAFLFSPEAQISSLYRDALESAHDDDTAVTNLMTGWPSRALINRLMREIGPMSRLPPNFPLAARALAPLRANAEARGLSDFSPLWAGQAAPLGRAMPAAELTRRLALEAIEHLMRLGANAVSGARPPKAAPRGDYKGTSRAKTTSKRSPPISRSVDVLLPQTAGRGELKTAKPRQTFPIAAVAETISKRLAVERTALVGGHETITFARRADPARTLTVAAVGDILLHDRLQKWALAQSEGYAALFRPVKEIINTAAVAFANLEGPMAMGIHSNGKEITSAPECIDGTVYSGYPMFNYHPSLATALKKAGIDVVLTANNHALDRHQLGVDCTIDAIKEAGLAYTGTRHRDAMTVPWYMVTPVKTPMGDFNIAWLGCAHDTNGIPDRANQVLLCYEHKTEVLSIVRQLSARPDVHAVFVVPHWGVEYLHEPDKRQRALARNLVEAGATAVIGSHPHVIQPIQRIVTKNGSESLVAYSLGNFISGQIGLPRQSTVILLLGLTVGPKAKLAMCNVGWIPLRMANHHPEVISGESDPAGRKHLDHLLKLLPAGNLHPATTKFWR